MQFSDYWKIGIGLQNVDNLNCSNYLRSLGDVFITETKNAKALQKRAKETTVNANGKINRKKRFGRMVCDDRGWSSALLK